MPRRAPDLLWETARPTTSKMQSMTKPPYRVNPTQDGALPAPRPDPDIGEIGGNNYGNQGDGPTPITQVRPGRAPQRRRQNQRKELHQGRGGERHRGPDTPPTEGGGER